MDDEIFQGAPHAEKLGALLWRTLDRLEESIATQALDPAQAREIIDLLAELTHALPSSSPPIEDRFRHVRSSWIQPRTHGSRP